MLLLPVSLSAADFGLAINANGRMGNAESEDAAFYYKTIILPRLSTLIGENGELIVSAGFSFGKEEDFFTIPELLRTELSMNFGNAGIRAGRINYTEPLSLIADGLFDGFQYYYHSTMGSFRIGAWYTGFQYKERNNIVMTASDQSAMAVPLDYGNFSGTYFASKRAFASLEWEHPSLGELVHIHTAVIAQMDLNDTAIAYHSQYGILKIGIPISNFLMELGGSVAFSQTITDETKYNTSYAGQLGLFWLFSSSFNSRLSLTGIIASGRTDDSGGEFIPVTSKEYGYILQAKIPGLSVFSLNYSAMLSATFGASFTASYFVRNDLGTFNSYPAADNKGYFLGPEAQARITWSPVSDLQFILDGGAFFPSLGDAGPEEAMKWRVDMTLIMSL